MWTIPKLWPGETVFIFGGGPSLTGFDPEQLRGRHTIAINRMVIPVDYERRGPADPLFDPTRLLWKGVPWADVLYFCDRHWWMGDRVSILKVWTGKYIVTTTRTTEPRVMRIENTGLAGLETRPIGVKNGTNSGYQAINLAYHFGAKRIILLGYDQNIQGLSTHVHGGYRHNPIQEQDYADMMEHCLRTRMLPLFERLVAPLAQAGVEVLVANPDSAIDCWPRITLAEALAF